MKIIILAAGKGERLLPLTQNTPKPLLDMGNGNTLLEEQLRNLETSGAVDEVILVIGYLAEQVEAKMNSFRKRGYRIRTIFNPFYEVANNFMSLWLARSVFEEGDVLVTNGDNLFAPEVFRDFAAECGNGIHLAVGAKTMFDPDDMRVSIVDKAIVRVSKQIPDAEAGAESPGLSLVRGANARRIFTEQLDVMARTGKYLTRFWLEVYNALYERGVAVQPWWFDTANLWQEVDFHPDLSKARSLLQAKIHRGAAFSGPASPTPLIQQAPILAESLA
jgi:choline kinase